MQVTLPMMPQAQPQATVKFGASYPTQFQVSNTGKLWEQNADVLVVPVVAQDGLPPGLKELNLKSSRALVQAAQLQGFKGATGQTLLLNKHPRDEFAAKQILLVGLGHGEQLTQEKLESAISKALQRSELKNAKTLALSTPENTPLSAQQSTEALNGGVNRATYQSRQAHKPGLKIESATLVLPKSAQPRTEWTPTGGVTTRQHVECMIGLSRARAINSGIGYAKDIANTPYNLMAARDLANEVQEFAEKYPTLSAEVKSADWVKKQMPSFYSVGSASALTDKPRFIKVTYTPPRGEVKKRIAVIGKSIMFDTGGVQGKGDAMNNMSKDKTGGAYALGLMKMLAELKPPGVQVTAYLPATPNMPGPSANLPDNILESSSGKKIKVEHTDAEGRLTLIDAVWQAANDAEAGKPDEIITLATLTGAAMRAVGDHVALITREQDRALENRIMFVARQQGEHFDTLPVCEDDFEAIKDPSDAADIRNSNAGAERGAQKAGAFVMNGLPEGSDIPLAHWDIAGVMGQGPGWHGEATGKGLRTLMTYVLTQARP